MTASEIIEKIKAAETMPELDKLRHEAVEVMRSGKGESFDVVQKAFIKKKNKLLRIPLKDRKW